MPGITADVWATCNFQPTVKRDQGIIMEPRIKIVILLPLTLQGLSYYVPKVGPPTPILQKRAVFGSKFHMQGLVA